MDLEKILYLEKFDKIHYTFNNIDGYNKTFNFVISGREPGKSTQLDIFKMYLPILEGYTILYLVRNAVEISPELIESIQDTINKWTKETFILKYKSASLGRSCVDTFYNGKLAIRFMSLSIKINTAKKLVTPKIKYIIMDEFILDFSKGEKYLKGEWGKLQEIYTTQRRENHNLKCYFCGNPYSKYNPYFEGLKINVNKLEYGKITTGSNWAVDYYKLNDELKEKILKENPLYQFDDDKFKEFAVNGISTNDVNIPLLDATPKGFSLNVIFKINGVYLAVWRASALNKSDFKYFISQTSQPKNRIAYCFDFTDLVENTKILAYSDRLKFENIRKAMRERSIAFKDIACYYNFIEIYECL